MKQSPDCLQSLWCFLLRSQDAQKPVFRTIGIWAKTALLFGLDSINLRSGDSLSHCPCPLLTKSVMGFRIQKIKHMPATNHANMIFLLALNQAEICDTWSPECDAADQAFLWLCQVSHKLYIHFLWQSPPSSCLPFPAAGISPQKSTSQH